MIRHTPVLASTVLSYLPDECSIIIDGTLGHGGHSQMLLEYYQNKKSDLKIIGFDRDELMIQKAKEFLKSYPSCVYVHQSYEHIYDYCTTHHIVPDLIFLDIGVNMEHFTDPKRWFSIRYDAPLDMRFDTSQEITAEKIINSFTESQLTEIMVKWWDFRQKGAEILAKHIITQRKEKNITTTFQLKDILRSGGLHEKVIAVFFQALRIETNQELHHLQVFLEKIEQVLTKKGSRCMIMTYHSSEDRMVKIAFKDLTTNWRYQLVNKKTLKPIYQEILSNKAARSAQLRIIEKL